MRGRGLTASASRFLPCFFNGAVFLEALNDLLQLLDPFPGERHVHLKLVHHALLQRADTHAKPVGLFGDSFVRDSEFLEVDPQIVEGCPVRVASSLQPLQHRLRHIDTVFQAVHCDAEGLEQHDIRFQGIDGLTGLHRIAPYRCHLIVQLSPEHVEIFRGGTAGARRTANPTRLQRMAPET